MNHNEEQTMLNKEKTTMKMVNEANKTRMNWKRKQEGATKPREE